MHEAILYEKREDSSVRCSACAHRCVIAPGRRGVCAVRSNHDGTLVLDVYGRAVGVHADPIEKKPLFHFHPGSRALSFGTVGCDFRCAFCQNDDMSQAPKHGELFGEAWSPEELVRAALEHGCASIAYTYNEPAIFIEYAHDVAKLAHAKGLKNVFVSNGYETEEALSFIGPYLDAINIDLKSFSDDFYRRLCGARLEPVLATLRRVATSAIWLEVTTLIIPDENDSNAELREIAEFIASLGKETPWHISRFFGAHTMADRAPTPLATLKRAARIGVDAGLRHVYLGNVAGDAPTRCPGCGAVVIERSGYQTSATLKKGCCPACSARIAGRYGP